MLIPFIAITFLPWAQCWHHKLAKRDLRHLFGVEEKHQVPDYHLIKPDRFRTDDGRLRLKFDAWNDTFDMELHPNTKLISPHLVSFVRNGSDVTEYKGLPLDYNCHFKGKIASHGDAPVAISDCQTLMGTLHLPEHFLVLQTIPDRIQHDREERHLVYKRNAALLTPLEHTIEEEIAKLNELDEPFCDTSESTDDPNVAQILSLNYSIPTSAQLDSPFIFPNMDPITLEIGLFLDSKLYEHFQREYIQNPDQHLMDFSLALINNVHVLYQQPTLSPNLEIVIVRYEMWKSQPSNLETYVHKGGQAQSLLDAFCRHQAHINPGTDLDDVSHWDHGVLLTGYDIYHTTASVAGVAPVARMCDPLFACSLVEGLHLGRSFVLAHEMGHNMGMVHDGVQNQCSRSCCLMSAVNGAGKTTWSDCSVREFNAFLMQLDESGRGNCLRDASPGLIDRNHLTDGRLPGQRFTPDQQCSYFWGRDYQVEIPAGRHMDDICRILWCGNSGSTISTAHPALEGSYCGGDKWCHEGRCTLWALGLPPPVIDGAWSDWSNGEKYCPVQQCNIAGSITIKAQHRDCVNPAPNNGGRPCEGSSIRGEICGYHISHCHQGLSREEFSSKVCSSIKHDPLKPDHQLTGEGFEHSTQPCKVWCHLIDSELIRNKGQFPDGAPCGEGGFCVSGVCLPLGCGNKAVVEFEEDCPVDPNEISRWSEWTSWTECSETCGDGGIQRRTRSCFDPLALHKCQGNNEEVRECSPKPGPCGVWTPWQDWKPCSQSCGGGFRRRIRNCDGGKCSGKGFEVEQCNTQACTKDAWGDWLPCSVSCGIGFQIRERLCDGVLCPTNNKQARTCNEQTCPTTSDDYLWGDWAEWSSCSATCGEGTQTRERSCRSGLCPSSESVRQRRCVLRACPTWNEWSSWSLCDTCSADEIRSRTRSCSTAFFFDPTGECEGPSVESQPCSEWCSSDDSFSKNRAIEILTSKGRRKIVAHGDRVLAIDPDGWGPWSEWNHCTASCGGGSRKRSRVCVGGGCQNQQLDIEKQKCNEQECEDGFFWSAWSEWTECSKSCGEEAQQIRRRNCRGFFSFQCSGPAMQTRTCDNLPSCPADSTNKMPYWSEWSPWSTCSCFTSAETRRRFCQIADPAIQGFCSGPILEQRPCKATNCAAVSGGWSPWSEWSSCSKDCQGVGHQIRNRMCSEPIPANRGAYCSGYSFDQRPCSGNKVCATPVNGDWTPWSEWSECSDSCNNGHKSRTRYCSNPRPSNGGQQCYGTDFELQPCGDPSKCHSIDGAWSAWSPWTDCPEKCGFALQSRSRSCDSPAASSGGATCPGVAIQTSVCNTQDCDGALDGEWSPWGEWSSCVSNCGVGSRVRHRNCSAPAPHSGGVPCLGRNSETEECRQKQPFCSRFVHHSQVLDSQVLILIN